MRMADVVIGDIGAGKTTSVARIVSLARISGIPVSGILAPRTVLDGKCTGYEIIDLSLQTRAPWMTRDEQNPDVGQFRIVPEGASLARRALTRGLQAEKGILIIDEIGPLELRGKGHGWALSRLKECKADHLLLVARRNLQQHIAEICMLDLRYWEAAAWSKLAALYSLHTDVPQNQTTLQGEEL